MTATTAPTPDDLMRAQIDHYYAEAAKLQNESAKLQKEAFWYPWIALAVAVLGSAPFWGAVLLLAGRGHG
jgi:hypothetical protein